MFGRVVVFALCLLCIPSVVQAKDIPDSFADLVEGLSPAVVNISTAQTVKQPAGAPDFPAFPPGHPFEDFNEFFKRFGGPYDGDRKTTSLGSGFVVDPEGYIVTNNHVIDDADEIEINFSDDTKYSAEVVGRDSKTDLALLKVNADKPLPYVNFGNSDVVRVGDWIVAIGNPFGLGGTVTAGIISARARDINAGPFDDFLQTDAAINRGNSGGPMFNTKGEVIGINTAIYSPNGVGNIGIGFAVPSNMAEPVIKQLKKNGSVKRGWLGVKIQTVTEDIADSLGMKEEKGALVAEVMPDSPAEDGGVMTGDIILTFDGQEVTTMRKLPRFVAETAVGKKVNLEVLRQGKKKTLKIAIGELKETDEASKKSARDEKVIAGDSTVLGMQLKVIDSDMREQFGLDKSAEGLVVTGIKHGSPASERNITRGDIILQVNQKKVMSVSQLEDIIKQTKEQGRKSILLLLKRGDETLFVALPIKEE